MRDRVTSSLRFALLTLVLVAGATGARADGGTPFDPPQIRVNPPIGSPSGISAAVVIIQMMRFCGPFSLLM